jgi:hypothetical protein
MRSRPGRIAAVVEEEGLLIRGTRALEKRRRPGLLVVILEAETGR